MYSYQGLSPLTSCQTFQATGVSTVTASEIKARDFELSANTKTGFPENENFQESQRKKFFSNLLTLPRTHSLSEEGDEEEEVKRRITKSKCTLQNREHEGTKSHNIDDCVPQLHILSTFLL
jgi:hypothetical protein